MRAVAVICIASLWVAGCGSPQPEIGRLSEQDLPEDAALLEARPSPEEMERGVLARIFGGGSTGPAPSSTPNLKDRDSAEAGAPEITTAEAKPVRRRAGGLFGLFGGGVQKSTDTDTRTAALAPSGDAPAPEPRGGGGFLGLGGGAAAGTSEIAFGMQLPYGRVAVICGVPTRQMGKKIASFPERRAQFALYDTDPGNTGAHTFYLTGFDDGCARQFTASLAVFGSVSMHEQLRYGLPAEVQPYSHTDEAYETLKARVCRVSKRKPCGARIGRLERDTVFLSIYERFGNNARWKNLLLHDGEVLAQDLKSS